MESNLGEAWCFPATSALLPCLGFQVAVVKMKQTGQVYAMKIMNKWDMLKRGEVTAGLGVQGAEDPPLPSSHPRALQLLRVPRRCRASARRGMCW